MQLEQKKIIKFTYTHSITVHSQYGTLYSLVCTELKSLKSQKGKIQIESAVAVSFDTN